KAMSRVVAQLPLFRHGDEAYCCLRRFISQHLLWQGIDPDSISQIAQLARKQSAGKHLSALYLLLAQQTASVIDANATGVIRILGLGDNDADAFRKMNRRQRNLQMADLAKSCTCKIAKESRITV